MAELLHNYVITKLILRNLSGQSIQTSTRNLEAELMHWVRKRTLSIYYYYYCPNFEL